MFNCLKDSFGKSEIYTLDTVAALMSTRHTLKKLQKRLCEMFEETSGADIQTAQQTVIYLIRYMRKAGVLCLNGDQVLMLLGELLKDLTADEELDEAVYVQKIKSYAGNNDAGKEERSSAAEIAPDIIRYDMRSITIKEPARYYTHIECAYYYDGFKECFTYLLTSDRAKEDGREVDLQNGLKFFDKETFRRRKECNARSLTAVIIFMSDKTYGDKSCFNGKSLFVGNNKEFVVENDMQIVRKGIA